MERVLVGVDGSSYSLHAARWAADLAERADLELVLARVHEPPHVLNPKDFDSASREHERERLEEWCDTLPGGARRPRLLLLDGDPPDALLDAGSAESVDLIVVGSRGAGGFAHLHIGSVAHHLLHLTHLTTLPLAVVPLTAQLTTTRLVVGNDGSSGSAVAVELTAKLAKALRTPVTAVYSYEPALELSRVPQPVDWHEQAEDDVRGWATPIEKAGMPLNVYVDPDRYVHPVAAIEYAMYDHPGSVAVLGTRGLGGFSGLRLGHVPLQLVNRTGYAVVLVPPLA